MWDAVALWQEMLVEATDSPGWLLRRLDPGRPAELFCALRTPERLPALILELHARDLPTDLDVPAARGFLLTLERLTPGPGGRVRLCLALRQAEWRTVFEALIQDVALLTLAQPSEPRQARAFMTRLRQWSRFMDRRAAEGLSDEEQLGLMAELLVLERLLLQHLSPLAAVQAWQGPTGSLHDFTLVGGALEVKGTARLPMVGFEVSSLAQLDEGSLQALILALVSLEAGPNVSGFNLPEQVGVLRARLSQLSPEAADLFGERLLEVGYLEGEAERYSARRFAFKELRLYSVRDGFPRIRVADVQSGVLEARYVVDIAACQPFLLTHAGGIQTLMGAVNG